MLSSFFFFNDTATTEIYTLSLHDALPIYHLRDRNLEVGGEPPDEAPDVRSAEEEGRIRLELDALARLPCHETVGTVAHRGPPERRAAPLGARHRAQQMCRQDVQMVHRVVEHLRIPGGPRWATVPTVRSEEHTSELQSP